MSSDIEEGVFAPTPKDQQLEAWCDTVGIDWKAGIQVLTTPVSMGSRNMFTTQLRIPEAIVFHPKNAVPQPIFPRLRLTYSQQHDSYKNAVTTKDTQQETEKILFVDSGIDSLIINRTNGFYNRYSRRCC